MIRGMGSVAIQLQKTPTKGYAVRKLDFEVGNDFENS